MADLFDLITEDDEIYAEHGEAMPADRALFKCLDDFGFVSVKEI